MTLTRIQKFQKIIELSKTSKDISLTELAKQLHISNRYALEYIEIIQYISNNPITITITKKNRFTFLTFQPDQDQEK